MLIIVIVQIVQCLTLGFIVSAKKLRCSVVPTKNDF